MMLLINLLAPFLFASVTIESHIDLSGTRSLQMVCTEGDSFCFDLCEKDTCQFEVASCRDCMSTYNNNVQVFLVSLGSLLQSKDVISNQELRPFVDSNRLMVWDSRSIYNNSEFDGVFIRNRFSSLCPLGGFTKSPLILDTLDLSNKFSYHTPKVVMCFYDQQGLTISRLGPTQDR